MSGESPNIWLRQQKYWAKIKWTRLASCKMSILNILPVSIRHVQGVRIQDAREKVPGHWFWIPYCVMAWLLIYPRTVVDKNWVPSPLLVCDPYAFHKCSYESHKISKKWSLVWWETLRSKRASPQKGSQDFSVALLPGPKIVSCDSCSHHISSAIRFSPGGELIKQVSVGLSASKAVSEVEPNSFIK